MTGKYEPGLQTTCQTCMGKGSYFIARAATINYTGGPSEAVEIPCPDCAPTRPLGSYQTDTFKTQPKQEPMPVLCEHTSTTPHYDHVACNDCGWVCPGGDISHRPHARGYFPSMEAFKQWSKYRTYPGMDSVKPLLKESRAETFPPVDPVRAHVAHCAGCEICEGWRRMFAETKPRYLIQAGWYDHGNKCFYTSEEDALFAMKGGNDVVPAWVPPKERASHG